MPSGYNEGLSRLLPTCSRGCGTRATRNGRYIRMLREDPHALDGWVCSTCRGVQRSVTPRAPRVRAQRVTEVSRIALTLDTTRAVPTIDVSKYETPFIGMELECTGITPERAKTVLGFEGEIGKNGGVNKKRVVKRLEDGGQLTTYVDTNNYNELPVVAQIYPDGTVPTEVVTRPLPLNQLDRVKAVHKTLKLNSADFWADKRAGTHMTILLNPHKAHSQYDKIVVQNVIQIARIWYPELIRAFGGSGNSTRGLTFRRLPSSVHRDNCYTEHHTAINVKWEGSQIWALEVRFPDGSNNWETLERQARFWSAVVRESAIISKFGLLNFSQERWMVVDSWSRLLGDSITATNTLPTQLTELLQESLVFFKYIAQDNTEQEKAKLESALRGG